MRYQWQKLSRQQVGAFSEYFVKMELTMYGFQVYTSEVDDRGVDFVARHENGPFITIQVKSLRKAGYTFMRKSHFAPARDLVLALAILKEDVEPELFLIPSLEWETPNALLSDRDYKGKKSEPEWGVNFSVKTMPLLEPYSFSKMISRFYAEKEGGEADA